MGRYISQALKVWHRSFSCLFLQPQSQGLQDQQLVDSLPNHSAFSNTPNRGSTDFPDGSVVGNFQSSHTLGGLVGIVMHPTCLVNSSTKLMMASLSPKFWHLLASRCVRHSKPALEFGIAFSYCWNCPYRLTTMSASPPVAKYYTCRNPRDKINYWDACKRSGNTWNHLIDRFYLSLNPTF